MCVQNLKYLNKIKVKTCVLRFNLTLDLIGLNELDTISSDDNNKNGHLVTLFSIYSETVKSRRTVSTSAPSGILNLGEEEEEEERQVEMKGRNKLVHLVN